jgi:enoyl-CoA hydratase
MSDPRRFESYGEQRAATLEELDGEDGIYAVTMDGPDEFNILSPGLMQAVARAFDAISALRNPDPNRDPVRAVILRAEGRAFTVGLDIGTLAGDYLEAGLRPEDDPFRAMWECPFPIIGAVDGAAVTGGFELALCCDVLLASKRAVFLDNHAKYGVHPGRRMSQRLAQVCGIHNAKLATLAAYPIEAETALRWGLVQEVYPNREALERGCLDLARRMAQNHPVMVKRYKDLIERGALETYRQGVALEEASEATFYGALTDATKTLADGAQKFQAMVRWVAERD